MIFYLWPMPTANDSFFKSNYFFALIRLHKTTLKSPANVKVGRTFLFLVTCYFSNNITAIPKKSELLIIPTNLPSEMTGNAPTRSS